MSPSFARSLAARSSVRRVRAAACARSPGPGSRAASRAGSLAVSRAVSRAAGGVEVGDDEGDGAAAAAGAVAGAAAGARKGAAVRATDAGAAACLAALNARMNAWPVGPSSLPPSHDELPVFDPCIKVSRLGSGLGFIGGLLGVGQARMRGMQFLG
ncbi:MAG: hypothetical protein IT499_17260 [Rubrivivax sp.]|nr:hypothetical protein [Rubrivivax sp.]MCL4697666.1 hypothetical protein [Burkholderiaceae bacterium]